MESHQFKRHVGGGKCKLCDELWPSMDGVVSKLQICERCGTCVHTSCKSLSNQCLPCGMAVLSPTNNRDYIKKGTLTLKLCQAYDLGPTSGALLYGIWRFSKLPFCRTENAVAGSNECVWSDQDQQSMLIDLNNDSDVELNLEVWNSYYEIFDKLLFTSSINLLPVLCYPDKRLERWFPLRNIHDPRLNGVAKVLVQLQFDPERIAIAPYSPDSKKNTENNSLFRDNEEVILEEPKGRTYSNLSDSIEAALLEMEETPKGIMDSIEDDIDNEMKLNEAIEMQLTAIKDNVETKIETVSEILESVQISAENGKQENPEFDDKEISTKEVQSPANLFSISMDPIEHVTLDSFSNSDEEDVFARLEAVEEQSKSAAVFPEMVESNGKEEQETKSDAAESIKQNYSNPALSLLSSKAVDVKAEPVSKTTNIIDEKNFKNNDLVKEVEQSTQNSASSKNPTIQSPWFDRAVARWSNFFSSLDNTLYRHVEASKSMDGISNFETLDQNAVGLLHLSIKGASYLKRELEAECDHFVLITIDGRSESFKTDIVRKSINPIFDAQFSLTIPYFRSNVTLTLMDAKTKRKIGSSKFFPYEVIVREADYRLNSNSSKPFTSLFFKDKNNKEDIGYFSLDVSFEENLHDHFWSPNVTYIPLGPDEELSVERLSVHIARFTAIMDVFNSLYQEYLHIMEWRDPVFTSVLFILFLYCIFYIHADYRFSGIFFGLVFFMTRTLYRRKYGLYKQMYVSRGKRDISLEYRPIAKMKISAVAFKLSKSHTPNFISQSESKTPMIKVTYHPILENSGENTTVTDNRHYLIGYLGGAEPPSPEEMDGVSQIMSSFVKSEINRKDWLLHNVMDPWPLEPSSPVFQEKDVILARHKEISLVYPILQPLSSKVIINKNSGSKSVSIKEEGGGYENDSSDHSSIHSNLHDISTDGIRNSSSSNNIFLPWTQNQSEIKITLVSESSSFLEEEEEYISISLLDIMNFAHPVDKDSCKYELMKWFTARKHQPNSPTDRRIILTDLDNYVYDDPGAGGGSFYSASMDSIQNRVFGKKGSDVLLRISFELPDMRKTFAPTEEEKRASFILQEVLSNRPEKESSTLAVLWNMRDHVKYVQNVMSKILNSIESLKNIFNWTNPAKTWPIYVCLIIMWLLTVFIPGRILILIWGLYQFLYIILPIPDGNEIIIRGMNFWSSIPNDDDIEQIYAIERKAYNEAKQKEKKVHMQQTLLNLSISLKWSASVKVKASKGTMNTQSSVSGNDWKSAFMIIQGKRIIWWVSEIDFENSKSPLGQLILTGLSGITQVSPVDQRLFENPQKLSAVFGQDPVGRPMKLSVSLESESAKVEFEKVVMNIISS